MSLADKIMKDMLPDNASENRKSCIIDTQDSDSLLKPKCAKLFGEFYSYKHEDKSAIFNVKHSWKVKMLEDDLIFERINDGERIEINRNDKNAIMQFPTLFGNYAFKVELKSGRLITFYNYDRSDRVSKQIQRWWTWYARSYSENNLDKDKLQPSESFSQQSRYVCAGLNVGSRYTLATLLTIGAVLIFAFTIVFVGYDSKFSSGGFMSYLLTALLMMGILSIWKYFKT